MSSSPNGYGLDKSLGHLAARFTRVLLRRINVVLSQAGLPITAEQYAFLIQLWERNGLPQGILAAKTARDKTTMARLASGLESRDLIVRIPSPADARERLVCLTDKGKKLMNEATTLVREILAEAQKGIDEGELEICRDVLRRTCLNLEK